MGNDASSPDDSNMKRHPSQPSRPSPASSSTGTSSAGRLRQPPQNSNHGSACAPPAYDELFGGASSSSASQIPGPASAQAPWEAPPAAAGGNWQQQQNGATSAGVPTYPTQQNVPSHDNPSSRNSGFAEQPPQNGNAFSSPPNWQEQEEMNDLRMLFAAVDENNDGFITPQELQQALLNDNWTPFNIDTIKMMLKMFDRNSNDLIEFEEFLGLKRYVQEWKKVFDQYDKDHSGTIDLRELRDAFRGMNYTFSAEFCQLLCRRFNNKQSADVINLDAFIYACAMVIAMTAQHERAPGNEPFEDYLRRWLSQGAR